MKTPMRLFRIVHVLMAFLFACAALILIAIAARMGWVAVIEGLDRATEQEIIEAVGLLAADVVAILCGRRGRAGHRGAGCDVQGHGRGSGATSVCGPHTEVAPDPRAWP